MKPVLFLDFDGVINSMRSRHKLGWNQFSRPMVERVNRIVQATGCKVVVSSAWRLRSAEDGPEPSVDRMRRILGENGFIGDVIDVTPGSLTGYRGHEIQKWLDKHPGYGPFVILDDSSDMEPFMDRLVQTEDAIGICSVHVDLAIELLGG